MIKAVLFDFDETLQDRTAAFEKYMDMLEVEGTQGELRMVYSILGEDERTGTNEYYKEEYIQIRICRNLIKNIWT